MTKFITATLLLRHAEQGGVSLTDPISEWFDLEYGADVTVRMLLNHTSGIPSYTEDGGVPDATSPPANQAVAT